MTEMTEEELQQKAEEYIPAVVRLFSGCKDEQTSADVSNVENFRLPDPAGKAGGACTSALLQVLYADEQDTSEDLTFEEVVLKLRENLEENFSQVGVKYKEIFPVLQGSHYCHSSRSPNYPALVPWISTRNSILFRKTAKVRREQL